MTTRISTAYQTQAGLKNLQASNSALELSSYQVTTGYKYRTLSDMSSVAGRVLTMRDVQNRTTTYMNNIESAQSQLSATEQALQDMADLISQASSLATQARNESSAETRATLAPKAQTLAESFYSTYQAQFGGTYLFSGLDGSSSPISSSAAATAYPGDPLSTDWYQGDQQLMKIVTGPSTTMSYGVQGDSEAFAQLKAALESLWYGLENNSVTEIDQAIVALDNAKGGITTMLGQVGGQMNGLTTLTDRYEQQQTLTKTQLDGLEKVDMSEALTTYSQQEAVLEASMTILTRMSQLTLLDYL